MEDSQKLSLNVDEKKLIETLYWEKNYSIKQIEQQTGIKNVSKKMDEYGIRKRTPKENFRVHVMGAVRKHRNKDVNYYSSLEKLFKKILEDLGLTEEIDWQHDAQIHPESKATADFLVWSNPQENIYGIDFECDEEIWHTTNNWWRGKEKDRKRDRRLRQLCNVEIHRLSGNFIRNYPRQCKWYIKKILNRFLQKHLVTYNL